MYLQSMSTILGKVKFSLGLSKYHAMKTYPLLSKVPRYEDVWVNRQLHSPRSTLLEGAPGTHWIGGWVGPRAGLDAVTKRRSPIIAPDGN